jgi:predicted transcriptional regulator
MSTLTFRLPDAKHERLKVLARSRDVSMNKLIDEWATVALAQHDAQARYLLRAGNGKVAKGLAVLGKLDRHFA